MMNTEKFEKERTEEANINLFAWCMRNLPVGRMVSRKDIESINRVKETNDLYRRNLFGGSEYCWYGVRKMNDENQ